MASHYFGFLEGFTGDAMIDSAHTTADGLGIVLHGTTVMSANNIFDPGLIVKVNGVTKWTGDDVTDMLGDFTDTITLVFGTPAIAHSDVNITITTTVDVFTDTVNPIPAQTNIPVTNTVP